MRAVLSGAIFVAATVICMPPAEAVCLLRSCVDDDQRGAKDDSIGCTLPDPVDMASLPCPGGNLIVLAKDALFDLCGQLTVAETLIDDVACGGDQDGSSGGGACTAGNNSGCVGGAPNGICDDREFATNCLCDCGCAAELARPGGGDTCGFPVSPDEGCFCDPECGAECCPDACSACGNGCS